jgi:hypothetical protein
MNSLKKRYYSFQLEISVGNLVQTLCLVSTKSATLILIRGSTSPQTGNNFSKIKKKQKYGERK